MQSQSDYATQEFKISCRNTIALYNSNNNFNHSIRLIAYNNTIIDHTKYKCVLFDNCQVGNDAGKAIIIFETNITSFIPIIGVGLYYNNNNQALIWNQN